MRNKTYILLLLSFFTFTWQETKAQDLPLKEWIAQSHDKPLVFYISGDGGFNKFSTQLCDAFNKKGYDVIALNAKSYFGDKKTPEQTTIAINNCIFKNLSARASQKVVMVGYSFGADVLPFVLNRLPQQMENKIIVSVLISSSGSTDFETHWSDMLGGNAKRSMDVVSELNKYTGSNVVIINGSDDNDLDFKKITLKNYAHEVLPGGHHFDGATEDIANVILKYTTK